MASLEPPIPAAAAHVFEAPLLPPDEDDSMRVEEEGFLSWKGKHQTWAKWRRLVGLLLLFLTVFLWTVSNFLASTIFADNTYSKPYFVTYLNTAFFIIPLVPILIRKVQHHPEEFAKWRAQCRMSVTHKYSRMRALLTRNARGDDSMSGSRQLLLGDEDSEQDEVEPVKSRNNNNNNNNTTTTTTDGQQLSIPETARLSLEFCLLWFAANYFVAACLEYTTVASSTILTSTSSVFTLLFGALFRVEKFSLRKLIAVLASLAGIALIAQIDLSGRDNDADHRGDFPEKSTWEIAVGDGLAFMSAVMYGIYAVFMKSRIGDESRVNMPLFFGLVGLLNVVLLWPGFIILHYTGIEPFALPPDGFVTSIIIANSLSSLVSDIAWAYAVLLTSPIVVTVGLSMTIPLSLVGQVVLNDQKASPLYWVGAVAVVVSFVFVNEEEKKEEEELEEERGGVWDVERAEGDVSMLPATVAGAVDVDEERFAGASSGTRS